jgi:hypothetical protein
MGAQLTVALPGTPPGTAIDQPGSRRAAMKLCFPPGSAHERRIRLTPSVAAHDPGLALLSPFSLSLGCCGARVDVWHLYTRIETVCASSTEVVTRGFTAPAPMRF